MPKPYASGVIPAPVEQVWEVVKDFNGLPGWLPAVTSSEIEGGGSGQLVGAVRKLALDGGGSVSERLVSLSDAERTLTYEFTDPGPFPVRSYRSTIRVAPITKTGQTFLEWWAWFDSDADKEAQLMDTYSNGVYGAGIDSLIKRFGG